MPLGGFPADGEGGSYDFFGSSQVLEGVAILTQARALAQASPSPAAKALSLPISEIIVELDRKLRDTAQRTAMIADDAARRRLSSMQKRPDTSKGVHLRDCIKSEAGVLGSVSVFLKSELNKAINRGSDKSYWQVIEEGSAVAYPGFLGRVLQGEFIGPGHADRPRAEFRDAPHPPGASFEFSDPMLGGGKGIIQREIEPVHFLKHGSDIAYGYFAREVTAAATRATDRLLALSF